MPIIKSAIKRQRQNHKRKASNAAYKHAVKKSVERVVKGKSKDIAAAYSSVDKAKKKGIIHKNKAARVKSLLSRLTKSKKK